MSVSDATLPPFVVPPEESWDGRNSGHAVVSTSYKLTPAVTRRFGSDTLSLQCVPEGSISERVWPAALWLSFYLECRFGGHDEMQQRAGVKRRPFRRVLELGSGTGLAGAVIAATGVADEFVLTDIGEALPLIHDNLVSNFGARPGYVVHSCIDMALESASTNSSASASESTPTASSSSASAARKREGEETTAPIALCTQRLFWGSKQDAATALRGGPFDLVICSDLVYFTHLFAPLISTLVDVCNENTEVLIGYKLRMMKEEAFWIEFGRFFDFERIYADAWLPGKKKRDAREDCGPSNGDVFTVTLDDAGKASVASSASASSASASPPENDSSESHQAAAHPAPASIAVAISDMEATNGKVDSQASHGEKSNEEAIISARDEEVFIFSARKRAVPLEHGCDTFTWMMLARIDWS